MSAQAPSVSVVTICKNAANTIERALLSVVNCSHPQLQYVVVDGGSTDGTLAIIERHRDKISKFVSEPDEGISDALNKAIGLTDGEYHILVHADDVLLPGALGRLTKAAANHPAAQVICGSVAVMHGNRRIRQFSPQPTLLVQKMSIPHMGALVRKHAWKTLGGYDKRRRIAMDHLLMLKILRQYGPEAFVTIDFTVAEHSLGGISDRQVRAGFRELRENLIEQGFGRLAANVAYLELLIKSRIARWIGRG
jgi:glycosyltransferase involved in cell wall biosynthesis